MSDRLNRGKEMNQGDELVATKGNCKLVFQGDQNLVVYALARDGSWRVVWSPQIEHKGGTRLVMQDDGNLVVYRDDNGVTFASGTDNKAVEFLVMQDDENLVLYAYDGTPVWATDTFNQNPYNPGTCEQIRKQITALENGLPADHDVYDGGGGKPPPIPPSPANEIVRLKRILKAKNC